MFKNKNEGNVVYKCTIRLLEDTDILECEFQVSSYESIWTCMKNQISWYLHLFYLYLRWVVLLNYVLSLVEMFCISADVNMVCWR